MTCKRWSGPVWGAVGIPVVLALAGVVLASSCGSSGAKSKASTAFAPPPDPAAPPPKDPAAAAPLPWTKRFLAAGVLVADEIRIEGPAPLLEHIVTRPEAGNHEVKVQTIPAGFQQTITVRTAGAEIRAQIDQVAISALKRLVILERPGPVDVLVIAAGDVFWKDGTDGQTTRAQSLRIEGPIPR
ncbi:MAG: hypothetical protein NTY35_00975 [Planctomycetota bacterium]|nr:hypothetical protein [Planctomycetota bacterium]